MDAADIDDGDVFLQNVELTGDVSVVGAASKSTASSGTQSDRCTGGDDSVGKCCVGASARKRRASSTPVLTAQEALGLSFEALNLPDSVHRFCRNGIVEEQSHGCVREPLCTTPEAEEGIKTSALLSRQRHHAIKREERLPSWKQLKRTRSHSLPSTSRQLAAMTLSSIDDADLYDEVCDDDEEITGPFSSMEQLVENPAHFACFIRFHFDNTDIEESDIGSILLYVLLDIYRRQDAWKNSREVKWFVRTVLETFCDDGALLRVSLREEHVSALRMTSTGKDGMEGVQVVFDMIMQIMTGTKHEQTLALYRSKRSLGFGSLYGESELCRSLTSAEGVSTAIKNILYAVLNQLCTTPLSQHSNPKKSQQRHACIARIILTFLVSYGVSVGEWISKWSSNFGAYQKHIKPYMMAFRSSCSELTVDKAKGSRKPKSKVPRWLHHLLRQKSKRGSQ